MIRVWLSTLAVVMLGNAFSVQARDLVYTPVNPVLGGSPLNAQAMQNLVTNNNRFRTSPEARRAEAQNSGTGVQNFADQITSALISQVASQVSQQIVGENARDSGRFAVGSTSVQFQRIGGQISIDIVDAARGGRTNIQLPAPQF